MKYAADFRSIARNALKGKWGIAVVAGLIASLLGAIGSSGPELNVELNDGNFNASLQIFGQDVVSSNGGAEFCRLPFSSHFLCEKLVISPLLCRTCPFLTLNGLLNKIRCPIFALSS